MVGTDIKARGWHLIEAGYIHHAGRDSDVRYGWSGVVFLDPKANMRSHQSWLELWAMRDSGRAWDTHPYYGEADPTKHELVLRLEPKFNRLVLFWSTLLHRAGEGYGSVNTKTQG